MGIERNVKNYALEEEPLVEIYDNLDRHVDPQMFLVIRARVPAMKLAPVFRQIVTSKEPRATIGEFLTMNDRTWAAGAARRFQTSILTGFAAMALVLAVVGLFGLVGHSVRMRTREIGLRAALGATRRDTFSMILGQGLRALTRFLATWLYGIGATDAMTFIGAPLLLVAAGLAACVMPGIRASRIDPAIALRYE